MDVLVADGSEFMRTLTREVLTGWFDDVHQAENGIEAIELYDAEAPDIVVMEADMPIRDGIEATEEITTANPSATVVVCTDIDEPALRERAMEAGASGYVTKPYQKQGLLDEVESALAD